MLEKKIIFNPKKISRAELEAVLNIKKIPFKPEELVMTEYQGNGIGLTITSINKEGIELIVGIGGDGTINEILNGMMQTKMIIPVSMIPLGSGEDICDGFIGTKDTNIAFQALADYIECPSKEKIKEADIGLYKSEFRNKYFANTFSFGGIDTQTVIDRENFKNLLNIKNLKRYDFIVPYSALHYKPVNIKARIHTDKDIYEFEEELSAFQTLNTKRSGGGLEFTPNAEIDDGFLDLLYLEKMGYIDILKLLTKLKKGKHLGEKGVHYIENIKKIEFEAEPQRFQTDGEINAHSNSNYHSVEVLQRIFKYIKCCN